MKEGAFVKNYFAHCVDVEELYENMVSPVCEKYELTYMEFTVLMFLTNNPQYDTMWIKQYSKWENDSISECLIGD